MQTATALAHRWEADARRAHPAREQKLGFAVDRAPVHAWRTMIQLPMRPTGSPFSTWQGREGHEKQCFAME